MNMTRRGANIVAVATVMKSARSVANDIERAKMIDKYNEVGILEHTAQGRATPMQKCAYPKCEECDKYHGHYCTVPMVISKQDYIIINDKIDDLMKRVLDLEILVIDEILGAGEPYIATEEERNGFTPLQKYWYDKSVEDSVKAAEFAEAMKNLKPSVSDGATVKIVKSTPLKKETNYTWDDYLGEDQ